MNRPLTAVVAVALALPVVALAAMIGQQELRLRNAELINVPVRGFDPRDLLRGHYITGQFDWDWETMPDPQTPGAESKGGLCILPGDAAQPKVRFRKDWRRGERADGCRVVIAGHLASSTLGPAVFVPDMLENDWAGVHLYVSETRAPELEELLRKRPGALTVDLAVRDDGGVAVKALRVDGKIVGR
jgi:hypothetical protein